MSSITQSSARKKQGNQKLCKLSCSGSAVENGGKFITFCEKEKAELLPKNIEKNSKIQVYSWRLPSKEIYAKPLQSRLINIGSDFKQHGNYLQPLYKRLNCSQSPIFP